MPTFAALMKQGRAQMKGGKAITLAGGATCCCGVEGISLYEICQPSNCIRLPPSSPTDHVPPRSLGEAIAAGQLIFLVDGSCFRATAIDCGGPVRPPILLHEVTGQDECEECCCRAFIGTYLCHYLGNNHIVCCDRGRKWQLYEAASMTATMTLLGQTCDNYTVQEARWVHERTTIEQCYGPFGDRSRCVSGVDNLDYNVFNNDGHGRCRNVVESVHNECPNVYQYADAGPLTLAVMAMLSRGSDLSNIVGGVAIDYRVLAQDRGCTGVWQDTPPDQPPVATGSWSVSGDCQNAAGVADTQYEIVNEFGVGVRFRFHVTATASVTKLEACDHPPCPSTPEGGGFGVLDFLGSVR